MKNRRSTGGADPIGISRRVRIARFFAGLRADMAFAVVDAVTVSLAYWAALLLRFVDVTGINTRWWHNILVALPLVVGVHLVFNALFGAYGHVWEFASVEEAMRLVAAALASGMVLTGGVMLLHQFDITEGHLLPLMVMVMGAGLALGLMGITRFRSRMFSFKRSMRSSEPVTTLVVGTGRAAANLARQSRTDGHPAHIVAFVSADGGPTPQRLAGLPVLGTLADAPALVDQLGIDQVVVADHLGADVLRELVDHCVDIDVRLRIAPDLSDVLNGNGSLRDVRDLELPDLLARPTVATDLTYVRELLTGKRVLVTGGGGSIGSEVVRQVCDFDPSLVLTLDNDSTHLYDALLDAAPGRPTTATPILADIRDRGSLLRLLDRQRVQVVFHAAALKHVPILEEFPDEAVKTNVVGTANLLDASRTAGVEHFVLISTDKAVEPTSVMGASKRVAEMLTQSAASSNTSGVYAAVRFGNVLGSRGSVVPTFMSQIRRGGPVTVSDPEMLRYFMTNAEAVQLVLQAAALAEGGEVFVLDMGEPVRIGDLARRMIRLAGLVPGRDIEVVITGPRPGEKLREVLSREALRPSAHPKISLTNPGFPGPVTLMDAFDTLTAAAGAGERQAVAELLLGLARHTWQPGETVRLDQLTLEPDQSRM